MGARAGFAPRRPPCALPPTSGPSRPAASWHQWPPRSARPPVRLSGSSRPSAMSSPATGPIVPIRANRTVSTDTHGRSSDQHHDDDLHKRCMTECSRSLSSWSCPPAARRARPGLDGWLGGTGGGAGISAVRPNRPPAWLAVRLARPLPPPSGPPAWRPVCRRPPGRSRLLVRGFLGSAVVAHSQQRAVFAGGLHGAVRRGRMPQDVSDGLAQHRRQYRARPSGSGLAPSHSCSGGGRGWGYGCRVGGGGW